jgi:hypothetical protein
MYKVFDLDSEFFQDEPVVRILDISQAKYLVKSAADSRIDSFAAELKPHPSRIYVHILAMGAGEYFGANRNGDYFPEENLIKWHSTFETSPAHIFQHHINKNPEIAIGQVIYSIYNERMHRVEIIAWIDKEKGKYIVDKINKGIFPATSMACHTPYDTCSICGNRARSRNEYCKHLREELGRIHPDGRKTMAINDGPLKFFDMSVVFKAADITSSVLQKLASYGYVIGSAENAETHSFNEKSAQIRKLSTLVKEVEGTIVSSSDSLNKILDKIKDPDEEVLGILEAYKIDHIIHALAELGISPSIGFFANLLGRKICGESVDGIEHLIQGLIQEDPNRVEVPELGLNKSANSDLEIKHIIHSIRGLCKQSSLFPETVMNGDLILSKDYRPSEFYNTHNVGYAGNGPEVPPDPRKAYRTIRDVYKDSTSGEHSMLKTLFTIGGAAIAAKWLLSRLIESKMQELKAEYQKEANPSTKIILVKSAGEAFTIQQLTKASLLRNLKMGV